MWSRFVFELVIWPQEVTLVRWTQPSGPLCLWQCFKSVPFFRFWGRAGLNLWKALWGKRNSCSVSTSTVSLGRRRYLTQILISHVSLQQDNFWVVHNSLFPQIRHLFKFFYFDKKASACLITDSYEPVSANCAGSVRGWQSAAGEQQGHRAQIQRSCKGNPQVFIKSQHVTWCEDNLSAGTQISTLIEKRRDVQGSLEPPIQNTLASR